MSVDTLTPRVREAMGVSASYDAESIPAAIRRSVRSLLRDYNFPKSIKRKTYDSLTVGQQTFAVPAGFRKPVELRFYDQQANAWTDPLLRRDGPVLPQADAIPRRYWIEGTKLWIDTPLSLGYDKAKLIVIYQSSDPEANEDWLVEDFEDVVFLHCMYWEAVTFRKPEVQQAYAPLWREKQTGMAIFLNELEFEGLEMVMREERYSGKERYPASGSVL